MEFLPSELLLNIFERLNVSDAGSCRLLNRRYDDIISKNWRKINKRRGHLVFKAHPVQNYYSIATRSNDTTENYSKCGFLPGHIHIFDHKKDELANMLAKRLDLAYPICKQNKEMNILKYSRVMAAFEALLSIIQLKYTIHTLELQSIDDDMLDFLAARISQHSVRSLVCIDYNSSNDVLKTMNRIGFNDIQTIHIIRRNKVGLADFVNNLLPQIPFKNIKADSYNVFSSLILQVIKNWANSNWKISLCVLQTTDYIDGGKDKIQFLSPELKSYEQLELNIEGHFGVAYLIQRKTDDHKLYVEFIKKLNQPFPESVLVRMFENQKNKYDPST